MNARQKNREERLTELVLETAGEVQNFEEEALEGKIEEGFYWLDVTHVERDMGYVEEGMEERAVPGEPALHSEEDLYSIALVSYDASMEEARESMRERLEEEYSDREFLGAGDYGISLRRSGSNILCRACYREE